ncbi:anti-sigma factor family protein [Streptacidiphilus rugosus]|uniref:anti-sigma factor family protein n=1 Tax=Streptacidiphilus rugosus TaxID=405783 RepID=UPI00068B6596|nr:anti-sigma factor [Streptacidiphilus rugosus]
MSESTVHPAHPEAELISDHIEGLLSAEESAELTAHLGDCPECREVHDALVELRELLGAEPDPGPMPEDVAARLDAVLAAEAARPAAAETAEAGGADAGGAEAGGAEAAEAEAANLAPAPAVTATDATDVAADDDAVGSAAGLQKSSRRPADNRPAGRSRGRTRLRRALTTLAIFAAAGGIGLAVSSGGDIDGGASSSAAGSVSGPVHPAASPAPGYEFTQAGLSGQIQQLARDHTLRMNSAGGPGATAANGSAAPFASSAPSASGRTTHPDAGRLSSAPEPTAPACVLNATKQSTPPELQGVGRYLGVEVFALLYPDKDDPAHRWDVYLVQDSCTSPVVLLQQSVPRA